MVVNAETLELIVVKWRNQARVYVNSCPHTGVTLNWLPDQFLTVDKLLLQCSMHGALFQPENGLCVYGPCLGAHLEPLDCAIIDDEVCLLLEDRQPAGDGDQVPRQDGQYNEE